MARRDEGAQVSTVKESVGDREPVRIPPNALSKSEAFAGISHGKRQRRGKRSEIPRRIEDVVCINNGCLHSKPSTHYSDRNWELLSES